MQGAKRNETLPAVRLSTMSNRVDLDIAAFLDSPQAGALTRPGREEVQTIARRFIGSGSGWFSTPVAEDLIGHCQQSLRIGVVGVHP